MNLGRPYDTHTARKCERAYAPSLPVSFLTDFFSLLLADFEEREGKGRESEFFFFKKGMLCDHREMRSRKRRRRIVQARSRVSED